MTRRDGDISGKMPRMERGDKSDQNFTGNSAKGHDLIDSETKSTGFVKPHANTRSSATVSDHGSIYSPRSMSLPGSRAGSRPGSRPGSRIHSRTNSQESIIDLFDCMTLTYGQNKSNDGQKGIQLVPGKGIQFVSPKPKQFRNQRWTWHDKVRINSAIWRAWHMQYIKGKKPVVCHFTAPVLEKIWTRLNPDVIQAGRGYTGSIHWNQSQLDNVVSHYRKWRVKQRDALQPHASASSSGGMPLDDEEQDAEEGAIDLDMPHPPHSPMFARKLANDDMPLKDFSDTLFISTGRKFNVPHPKKITQHVYNADIIQPGLMQLEPDFDDDFMDTLESLTDILMKTPTKPDLQGFNLASDFPTCFLESDSLSNSMDTGAAERVLQSNPTPQPTTTVFPVSIQPSTPHVVRNLNYDTQTRHVHPQHQLQQQQQINHHHQQQQQVQHPQQHQMVHQQQQHQQIQQQRQQIFHQSSSGAFASSDPQTTFVLSGQQPLMMMASGGASQSIRTGFIPIAEVATSGAHGASNIAIGGFDPNQIQHQGPSLIQTLTGQHNPTLQQINSSGFPSLGSATITPIVSTATVPSHSISSAHSKVEPLSPTPSNRQPCEVMGIVNEAIDVLTYQLPMSPSRMIPPICTAEWSSKPENMNWSLAETTPTSNSVQVNTLQQAPERMDIQEFSINQQKPPYNQRESSLTSNSVEFEAVSPAGSSRSGSTTPSGMRTPSGVRTPSGARTPSGTITPPTKSHKRDRDGNFSHSNSTSPRTSFTSLYPDSALAAALNRKSDVKDIGMLSPTTDREGAFQTVSSASYPSTAASSAASSPGTPHNDMGEVPSPREFEFPNQKAKRQKTPDPEKFDKETRRRLKHLKSEHKRRFNIQTGLDEIQALIPSLKNTPEGTKISTATLLVKAHEHIIQLKEDSNKMKSTGEDLKKEIDSLNDEIEKCQDELPDSGAPVNPRNDRALQAMLNAYITEKASANWKFWIFSLIVRPLFETYLNAVCDNPSTDFSTAVTEWTEEHCRLRALRTVVLSALRKVSKNTTVLTNPSRLPDQVAEIVKKESANT